MKDSMQKIETNVTLKGEEVEVMSGMMDYIPDILFLSDQDGCFLSWNKRFPEKTGFSVQEIDRMSPLDLVPEEDRKEFSTICRNVFQAGTSEAFDSRLRMKNEGSEECSFFLSPIISTDHQVLGLLGVIRNRSDQKLHRERNGRAKETENGNGERNAYINAIAHDIRAPLRRMRGFSQLLQSKIYETEETMPNETETYIDNILESGEYMDNMIDALLRLSRISGKDLKQVPFSLQERVNRALYILEEEIKKSGADISIEELPEFSGDPDLITQVFQNLISNAIDYSGPEVPVINIRGEQHPNYVVVSVRDQGMGMEHDEQNEVFRPFVSSSSYSNQGHMGIGLALCRKIIDMHNGRIWIDSDRGEGTRVQFMLSRNGN